MTELDEMMKMSRYVLVYQNKEYRKEGETDLILVEGEKLRYRLRIITEEEKNQKDIYDASNCCLHLRRTGNEPDF